MVDLGVPSGRCSDTRPLNIDNHFVVNPYYAFTYERKKGRVQRTTPLSVELDQQRSICGIRHRKQPSLALVPEVASAASIAHSQSLLKALSLLPP
jgi:hypothetical protein